MHSQTTSRNDQLQQYAELYSEVVNILLSPDSPARGFTEFDELIAEHDHLHSCQAELQTLDAKLVEVLPGLEQAEGQLAEAEKQLAAEKKKLAGFASELGKTAFAGLRAGELPDHPHFAARKELQTKIEGLQRQLAELTADENAGMLEKAKVQAQQFKLTGQIKVEELKIGSFDRALGQALLTSKEKPPIQCEQTGRVLEAIAHQRDQVATARNNVKNCKDSWENLKKTAAQTLGRPSVQATASLNNELKNARRELRRNKGEVSNIRESLVTKALKTDSLRDRGAVGQKLRQLSRLKVELAASKPQWLTLINEIKSRFLGLPEKRQTAIYVAAGTAALVLFIAVFTGGDTESSLRLAGPTQSANPKRASNGSFSLSEADTFRQLERLGAKITEDEDGVTIFFDSNTMVNSLPSLEPIADLNGLIIKNGSLAGDKLAAIKNAKNLRGLVLNDCHIDDDALAYLNGLRSLRLLVLNNNDITGKALTHIAGLRELRILELRRGKIEDNSLRHLKGLKHLQELNLSLTPITGSGLGVTEYMPNLRKLDLHACLLLEGLPLNSDDKGLRRLEQLNLQGCVKLPTAIAKQFNGKIRIQSVIEQLTVMDNAPRQFAYHIGDTIYQGLSEREKNNGEDIEYVYASSENTGPSAAIIDWKKRIVTSGMLGLQDGKLIAGPGRDGMILTIAFKIRDPGDVARERNPGRTLAGNLMAAEIRYQSEEGVSGDFTPCGIYVKWMNPGPGFDKQPFWGKAASRVPRRQQVLGFDNGAEIPVLSLGEPIKVSPGSGFDTAEYGDLSPALFWSFSRNLGGWKKPRFVAGSRVYEMDESAKQVLNLVARAVGVVRHSEGYRVDSQKALGD